MSHFISYGRQSISQDDIDCVVETLKSDYLTQGAKVKSFEGCISAFVESDYAVAVSNATAALHLSCLALGVGPGDLVWTSPITFVSSANVAYLCGATVDFVDINSDTYNMDVEQLELKLIQAKIDNKLPKVVIPVHFGGLSCDMRAIYNLSQKYGFNIIEDASHAIGAKYDGRRVGCCQYSDISVFSFHPVKIITTGEGGVVTTNNKKLADTIALLRSHGVTRDKNALLNNKEGAWYYEQHLLGLNYRITDIQCALGISQLERISQFLIKRQELANRYQHALKDFSVKLPVVLDGYYSSWHLYCIQLLNSDRRQVFDELRKRNIGVNVHYIPVHLQPYYRHRGFNHGDFPVAEAYYENAITLPLHPGISDDEIDYIVSCLKEAIEQSQFIPVS